MNWLVKQARETKTFQAWQFVLWLAAYFLLGDAYARWLG